MAAGANSKILIIGSTGHLGQHMVRASVSLGHPTYAYVRPIKPTTDSSRLQLHKDFEAMGLTLFLAKRRNDAEYPNFNRAIWSLARGPQFTRIYKACYVNGIKYVSFDRNQRLVTQNSRMMLSTNVGNLYQHFYGHLDYVVEVCYPDNLSVVFFKVIWHNTTDDMDAEEFDTIKVDHGLISVDTNSSYYENSPFCLAIKAKQVFYLDNPAVGGTWKVVQEMSHRNVYSAELLATKDNRPPSGNQITEPYQEDRISSIQFYHIDASNLQLDLEVHEQNEESNGEEEEDDSGDEFDEEEEEEDEDDDGGDDEEEYY